MSLARPATATEIAAPERAPQLRLRVQPRETRMKYLLTNTVLLLLISTFMVFLKFYLQKILELADASGIRAIWSHSHVT